MRIQIPDTVRAKTIYVLGVQGMGKSTLLHAMAYQDIKNGRGLCLIDPTGDLVNQLLHWIPKNRVDDVILMDTAHPIPLDFLSHSGPKEGEILTDDIVNAFDPVGNAPRMKGILHKLLPTLFHAKLPPDRRPTFLDIYRFLVETKRQKEILAASTKERQEYWKDHFPRGEAIEPILNRMAIFTESPTLRTIFGGMKDAVNIPAILQSGKILLVSIDRNESDRLFGSMLVSKIQQAAFRRRTIPPKDRKPFCLYVDEFQNFASSQFDVIIEEGRKFNLWLTIAHQNLSQLTNQRIKGSVFSASTMILMRTSEHDAVNFRAVLGKDGEENYHYERLPTLQEHTAFYIVNRRNLGQRPIPAPPPFRKASNAEIIRKRMVENYACEVETAVVQLEKDDDIAPSTGPQKNIPSHARKAKSRGASR